MYPVHPTNQVNMCVGEKRLFLFLQNNNKTQLIAKFLLPYPCSIIFSVLIILLNAFMIFDDDHHCWWDSPLSMSWCFFSSPLSFSFKDQIFRFMFQREKNRYFYSFECVRWLGCVFLCLFTAGYKGEKRREMIMMWTKKRRWIQKKRKWETSKSNKTETYNRKKRRP